MDGTARLWRTATTTAIGEPLRHAPGHFISTAAISHDGALVLTCGTDLTARLWHVSDGTPAAPPMYHLGDGKLANPPLTHSIRDYDFGGSFSKNERFILTWGSGDSARLWNRDGSPAGQLELRPNSHVKHAVFSDDERFVLLWGLDGARVSNIRLDGSVPKDMLPLYVEVLTGTTMDEVGSVNVLSPTEWAEKRRLFGVTENGRARTRRQN
jgi:WD40 repeat protein